MTTLIDGFDSMINYEMWLNSSWSKSESFRKTPFAKVFRIVEELRAGQI
jgi:hypothetical protein